MVESVIPETKVIAIASHVGSACFVSTDIMTDTLHRRSSTGEYLGLDQRKEHLMVPVTSTKLVSDAL